MLGTEQDQQQPLQLPPGATLVSGGASAPPTIKLPPGATLVSGGQSPSFDSRTAGLSGDEAARLQQAMDARPWWRKTLGMAPADPGVQDLIQKHEAAVNAHINSPEFQEQVKEGLRDFYTHDPGGIWAMGTASNLAEGGQELTQGEIKKGAHRIIKGATIGAAPLVPLAIANAPIATAGALVGGAGGGIIGGAGAKVLGGDPDTQQLAADIGGLVGGYGGGRAGSNLTGAGFKNFMATLDKVAPAGSIREDVLEGLGGYRFKKAVDIGRKIANVIPDQVTSETHPATTQLMNDALNFIRSVEPAIKTELPQSSAPSYFETGATAKTNVPLTKLSARTPLLQSLREFEIMNRAVNEMNAQEGVGQEEILAEMNRAGGAWRGKESALPNTPPQRSAAYLKAARTGLPDGAPDGLVAQKAAFLKHQDEHLVDLLQQSIDAANAKRQ